MYLFRSILSLRMLLPLFFGGIFLYAGIHQHSEIHYDAHGSAVLLSTSSLKQLEKISSTTPVTAIVHEFLVTHLLPPQAVKAAYMTSCIASGKKLRTPLVKLIEETELNSLVIDIKDYTGMVSIDTGDTRFVLNSKGCHIPDIKEFIAELHTKGIYVIGRVTVFQDTVYPRAHPHTAVVKKSDGTIWKDRKGITFIDPGATEYWEHTIALAKASYGMGFDEINFDYIRYPSDGNMSDIHFPRSGTSTKSKMMGKFYMYLGKAMREAHIPSSADLFGMTTTQPDDMNIGQVLEDALLAFDYVAPMVYPSHYPSGFNGWKDPNQFPYEIIKFSMDKAVLRANALEEMYALPAGGIVSITATSSVVSSSTPPFLLRGIYANKLRPWIQDFDYGKVYTEADVRAQKKAVYDAGLTSWMVWDPTNKYTPGAFNKESLQ